MIRRILVATDFSQGAECVLESAAALALGLRACIDLVHVRDPLATPPAGGFMVAPEQRQGVLDTIDGALAAAAQRVIDRGVTCVTTSLEGSPPVKILAHARKVDADLIVVGHHGDPFARALGHGVTADVLRRACCPVLVVPSLSLR